MKARAAVITCINAAISAVAALFVLVLMLFDVAPSAAHPVLDWLAFGLIWCWVLLTPILAVFALVEAGDGPRWAKRASMLLLMAWGAGVLLVVRARGTG